MGAARRGLALLRLALLYAVVCAALFAAAVAIRHLLEAGWGLGGAPAAPPSLSLPGVGVTVELAGESSPARRAALERLHSGGLHSGGLRWVRQRFDWAVLEPQPGLYQWSAADSLVDDLARSGLAIVVVLDGSPAWARPPADRTPDNPLAPPADFADFARFAAAFAARYGDRLTYYQLWDEPNIAPHWGVRHVEPVAYARLLAAAAPAVRAADPDAVIAAAALAPTVDRGHLALDEVSFLLRMVAAGAADHFDVVAVQPFGFGAAPDDPAARRTALTFSRAAWVRRALVAAGLKDTPIWAVRYGWNDRPASPWATVQPAHKAAFAGQAARMARTGWPWLTALGWAVDQPAAPPADPAWGFALTGDTLAALAATPAAPLPPASLPGGHPPWGPLWRLGGLAVGLALAGWRAAGAARLVPWRAWGGRWRAAPPLLRALSWLALAVVYYFATWPPLIALCWLAAALAFLARPLDGVLLAAALLPFDYRHKELAVGEAVWAVAPAHAALLCLLPALLRRPLRLRTLPRSLHAVDWLALAWLAANLGAAANVWRWPAYAQGLLDLALAPLILYAAVRLLAPAPREICRVAAALALGGTAVALLGLAGWLAGQGVDADGLRRLTGPYYSPNHAALYLLRSLWPALALAAAARRPQRVLWGAAAAAIAAALALTASRGALLLGLPAGALALALLAAPALPRRGRRRLAGAALGGLLALLVLAALFWERAANTATFIERWIGWQATLRLWSDFPLLGVGPGGFFWRFPAYLPPDSAIDPNLLHPHALWLEFPALWGALGLLWLAAALFLLLDALRRAPHLAGRTVRWVAVGLLAALFAALAHAQVDAFMALPDLAGWNWAALALLVNIRSNTVDRRHIGTKLDK